jgi:hypothetical protein
MLHGWVRSRTGRASHRGAHLVKLAAVARPLAQTAPEDSALATHLARLLGCHASHRSPAHRTPAAPHRVGLRGLSVSLSSGSSRVSQPHRPREDGIAYPADTSRTNLASALLQTLDSSGGHHRASGGCVADEWRCSSASATAGAPLTRPPTSTPRVRHLLLSFNIFQTSCRRVVVRISACE